MIRTSAADPIEEISVFHDKYDVLMSLMYFFIFFIHLDVPFHVTAGTDPPTTNRQWPSRLACWENGVVEEANSQFKYYLQND